MKIATQSFGRTPHECKLPWPDDFYVQCGDSGIVFTKHGSYKTAFFEAFPPDNHPSGAGFIRGEGTTVEIAEKDAWNLLRTYESCDNHEFERRTHTNGSAFCKKCDMFKSDVFAPSTTCVACNTPTNWAVTPTKRWLCQDHCNEDAEYQNTETYKLSKMFLAKTTANKVQ